MSDDGRAHTDAGQRSQLYYVQYESEKENEYVAAMRQLISKDLSEPYSIYVYRYFLYQWGDLCFMVGILRPAPLVLLNGLLPQLPGNDNKTNFIS
jgi:hypothetical protein